ncbi:glycoside hydrolase/deacetylase [Pleurotus eryngii]|uniref:Glycoside hydrolase/deacetylase n=1 Tax=Pleurotus eryngii TaxID=5323 RepID=A0A9P5ZTC2_PLEER|nr:glycoside hydrolase/deacetylase [Pleurotus eryngii]
MFASLLVTVALALFGAVGAAPQKRAPAQVYRKCTVANTVALTFDDGPYTWLNDISDALSAARAQGTFFFNGNNFGCIYDDVNVRRVKYAYDNGHQVASHTWSHKDLTTLSSDQINDEMERVELALQRICGVQPAFMRPPFGNYNDLVLEVSGARGQDVAIWDFDSGDSLGAPAQESINRYDQVASQHPSSILTLNHETIASTSVQVVPYAIQRLQQAGYRLVTLAECLGQQPYHRTGDAEGFTPPSHSRISVDYWTVFHQLTTFSYDALLRSYGLRFGSDLFILHLINFFRLLSIGTALRSSAPHSLV